MRGDSLITFLMCRQERLLVRAVLVWGLSFSLLGFSTGCFSRAASPGVLAEVGGYPIEEKEMEQKLTRIHFKQSVGEAAGPEMSAEKLRALLDEIIQDTLMYQEAQLLELDREPAYVNEVEAYLLTESVRKLRKEDVLGKIPNSDEALRAYADHYRRRIRIRSIYSRDQEWIVKAATEMETTEEFAAAAKGLPKEGQDAEEIKLPPMTRESMSPELGDALFQVSAGEVCGPMPYGPGWAVFLVQGFEEVDDEYFSKNKGMIRSAFRKKKEAEIGVKCIETYRARTGIEINEALLDLPDEQALGEADKPVALVGDDPILMEDFVKARKGMRTRQRAGPHGSMGIDSGADREILEKLIHAKLIEGEALLRHYEETDAEFREALDSFKKKTLVKIFKRDILSRAVKVEEREIEAYYRENKESFRPEPRVRLHLIVFPECQRAHEFLEELNKGASFVRLLDIYKEDDLCRDMAPSWKELGRLSGDLRDLVRGLDTGEVSAAWQRGDSCQVIKLIESADQEVAPYSRVREEIRIRIGREKYGQIRDEYLSQLLATVEIHIHKKSFEKLQDRILTGTTPGKD